jgi:hypothetical protein
MAYEIELEGGGLELEIKGLRGLLTLISVALLCAAIVRELRLPPEQRTWHGAVFGKVPYDLRVPSIDRLIRSVWNPGNPRLLVPTAFGVGWSVNVAALPGLSRASSATSR